LEYFEIIENEIFITSLIYIHEKWNSPSICCSGFLVPNVPLLKGYDTCRMAPLNSADGTVHKTPSVWLNAVHFSKLQTGVVRSCIHLLTWTCTLLGWHRFLLIIT